MSGLKVCQRNIIDIDVIDQIGLNILATLFAKQVNIFDTDIQNYLCIRAGRNWFTMQKYCCLILEHQVRYYQTFEDGDREEPVYLTCILSQTSGIDVYNEVR